MRAYALPLAALVFLVGCGSDDSGGGGNSGSGGTGNGGSGGGAGSDGGSGGNTGGSSGSPPVGSCAITNERIRITEIDVGANVSNDEDEAALRPLVISPIPSGGSRIAWLGNDQVQVQTLDANDQPSGTPLAFPADDFSDMLAHDQGGVLLLTRTKDCGADSALCGTPPDPPIPCHEMLLVRFENTGEETWATPLTDDTTPYSDGANFIWWYAHHGRIAWSGNEYAAHFGTALSVNSSTCIDIHQGDREKVVNANGGVIIGGWNWGCSHSGYERVIWDAEANRFAGVCKTDNQNRIMYNVSSEVRKVDLWYSNVGNLVTAPGGYWLTTSDIEPGQPEASEGHADVHLLQFVPPNEAGPSNVTEDDVIAGKTGVNERAPHLAAYGADRLLTAWEESSDTGDLARNDPGRQLYLQVRSRANGEAEGDPLAVELLGNRYQDFVSFPDGSVAFAAPGSSGTQLKILRILPCMD